MSLKKKKLSNIEEQIKQKQNKNLKKKVLLK